MRPRLPRRLLALFPLLVAIVVYGNALGADFVRGDTSALNQWRPAFQSRGDVPFSLDRFAQRGRESSSSPSDGGASRRPKERPVVLVLDPGHGGKDRGGFNERGFPHENGMVP